ncbi:glucan 1,4-alpha-glucosidase [Sugiyamaella lignohabitans]|uniref:glucan 1,4-alpha-glucosidase n=1 Tax=Sugiyamaella lignohabitans TaxID=796027 RepID=A0A161HIX5_9ASCO|nr:glucan 1,4-alpha-glucosidase [Sugiyamaella lignohabitans]ANB11228.1 glucan 1,4-alpha-glucosidase [Sugiyamaella lignohabitans]
MLVEKFLILLASCSVTSSLPIYESLSSFVGFTSPDEQKLLNGVDATRSSSSKGGHRVPGSLINEIEYEDWLKTETDLAFDRVISNIGGYGQGLDDVLPGAVIASPSKSKPNYYYIWTRDAAISINSLITRYDDQKGQNETLRSIINDYLNSSAIMQHVDNPSGTFENLEGLGEPKFMVDGRPFTSTWGRPQRDGPPLRASTMINYVNSEVRNNNLQYKDFEDLYYNVIRPDLDYVVQHWKDKSFDLWEEVYGNHFFTSMVQLKSLIHGAEIAHELGDKISFYVFRGVASELREYIRQYWDSSRKHLVETLDSKERSGLDTALFLGSIHAIDLYNWDGIDTDELVFPPYSDEVIASIDHLVNDMRYRFPINARRLDEFSKQGKNNSLAGVGIGRYPEDVYDGADVTTGNPWFLCTATVSQTLYLLADHLITRPDSYKLVISDITKPFYSLFLSDNENFDSPDFSIARTNEAYTALVKRIIEYADSFLDVIREHHANDGSMSEQFSRYDGYMRGATHLTWSYSAFWAASRQRNLTLSRLY